MAEPDDLSEIESSAARQAARERAFWLLAATVTALFTSFLVLGGLFLWYDSSVRQVSHTHEVRSGIADIAQALSTAESAQRGYLLTDELRFRAQSESALAAARAGVAKVEGLTQDNPEQQRRLERLRTHMDVRVSTIEETLRAKAAGREDEALAILRGGRGIAAMVQVRRIIGELAEAEAKLEAVRGARARGISTLVLATLAGFSVLLAALFMKAIRDINLDRAAEAATSQRLRELVRQRTLLLDEVNHRVKNSLQQIASVVRLQSRSSSSDDVRRALDDTLSRIMAVGRVHEQIYKSGAAVGGFDAGLYAGALAQELVASMGREDIRLETEIDSAELDISQAAPIALILNELITNALKYGCPPGRSGCIRVKFKADEGQYRMTVADEGDGLPDGFTLNSRSTLGLRAVQALARQLGGEFLVEDSVRGAAFTVAFPKSGS